MNNLTNQQKFYLIDSTIVNLEKTVETLELTATQISDYAAFLAEMKTIRSQYYSAYNSNI